LEKDAEENGGKEGGIYGRWESGGLDRGAAKLRVPNPIPFLIIKKKKKKKKKEESILTDLSLGEM